MSTERPDSDQQWDRAARSETKTERLDRNWTSLLLTGLLLLGLALTGVTVLVFDAVVGQTAGVIAGAGVLVAVIGFWVFLPRWMRHDDTA